MGTTGRLFEKKVDSLIRNSNIYKSVCNKKYSVVFLNAIQYQCSLGGNLSNKRGKEIRDNNWNLCFENPAYNDIVERIEAINPYLVINLCTKGLTGMQSKLEEKLYNEILLKYNKIKYAKGTHPSTWNFGYAFMKMVV